MATAVILSAWAASGAYIYSQKLPIPETLDAVKATMAEVPAFSAFLGLSGLVTILVLNAMAGSDPLGRTAQMIGTFLGQEQRRKIQVESMIDQYNHLHDDSKAGVDARNSSYTTLVNAYYELATLFYEWGWGQSFHFANELSYENFQSAIRRHEYYLAGRLGVKTGDKVLDVGCGIGGPMRNIASFTGANITGITINEYQVQRGNELNKLAGLENQAKSVQGDFMKLPFAEESFDGVYAIEATCHAPRRETVYGEIFRVLKPGSVFACYEWCLTDAYDPKNAEHRTIKKQIEEGDGLPDMARTHEVVEALRSCGFEILEHKDKALDKCARPWFQPLTPSYNVFSQRFQFTPIGMWLTTNALKVLEFLRLAPAGTSKVQVMLQQGGMGCANGGVTGTFTPMFLMVARKPLKK